MVCGCLMAVVLFLAVTALGFCDVVVVTGATVWTFAPDATVAGRAVCPPPNGADDRFGTFNRCPTDSVNGAAILFITAKSFTGTE